VLLQAPQLHMRAAAVVRRRNEAIGVPRLHVLLQVLFGLLETMPASGITPVTWNAARSLAGSCSSCCHPCWPCSCCCCCTWPTCPPGAGKQPPSLATICSKEAPALLLLRHGMLFGDPTGRTSRLGNWGPLWAQRDRACPPQISLQTAYGMLVPPW
jgi:hypothetical protein